ncbi:hypothetical protein ACB092_11G265300 [Castanea dentata]
MDNITPLFHYLIKSFLTSIQYYFDSLISTPILPLLIYFLYKLLLLPLHFYKCFKNTIGLGNATVFFCSSSINQSSCKPWNCTTSIITVSTRLSLFYGNNKCNAYSAPTFAQLSTASHKLQNSVGFYDEVFGICNASLSGE